MIFELRCSPGSLKMLSEFMQKNNIALGDNANVVIVENGYSLNEDKINICFSEERLGLLLDFLSEISKNLGDKKPFFLGRNEKNEIEIIELKDIYYIEALNNDVFCHLSGRKLLLKERLYTIEEKLNGYGFIRISKAFIVNMLKIDSIIPWINSKMLLKLKNGAELDVTRNYLQSFKQYIYE
jgi:DNA-binding LytR/AlgR family response regulator